MTRTKRSSTLWCQVTVRGALLALAVTGLGAADDKPQALTTAEGATGAIAVEWRNVGELHPAWGTGFAVHPDGYILTDRDVVADPGKTKGRASTSRLILLNFMRFNSGGSTGEVARAKLVTEDRRRGLALIKTATPTPNFLSIDGSADLAVGDPVWVVDTPRSVPRSGWQEPPPKTTARAGVVTAVQRGTNGALAGFMSDLTLLPDHAGAPIINRAGAVVGMVTLGGPDQVPVVVGARTVSDFMARNAVEITFDPAAVLDLSHPVEVKLKPTILVAPVASGSVRVELAANSVDFVLEPGATGWATTLEMPIREPSTSYESAIVTLTLADAAGSSLWARRVRLSVIPSTLDVPVAQTRRSAPAETRELDYLPTGESKRPPQEKSGELAKLVESVTFGDGEGMVVDNNLVSELTAFKFDPARYEALPDGPTKQLAEAFDRTALELKRAENSYRLAANDANTDQATIERMRAERDGLFDHLLKLAGVVRGQALCRCYSRIWSPCQATPCDAGKFVATINALVAIDDERRLLALLTVLSPQ